MEEKNEKVIEEVTQKDNKQDENKENVVKVNLSEQKENKEDNIIKVDLNNPPKKEEDATEKQSTDEVPVRDGSEASKEVREENEEKPEEPTEQSEEKKEEVVLEEITEDSTEEKVTEVEEQVEEAIAEAKETGKPLPENIQKLVDFMEETGGDINDYVRLNQDYSKLDDMSLLREYYKQTKSHLNDDEISFLMEDQFSYDVNVDAEGDDIKIVDKAVKANIEVGLSPTEEIVQDSLEAAMKASEALGDEVLTDQIGNTITYFTRQFVVGNRTD